MITANRRALASQPAGLVEIVNSNFDAAAARNGQLLDMDRALQSKKSGADGNAKTGCLAPLVALR